MGVYPGRTYTRTAFSAGFLFIAAAILLPASCVTSPASGGRAGRSEAAAGEGNGIRREAPGGVVYRPQPATLPALPSLVGGIAPSLAATISVADRAALSAEFRDAYIDASFRDPELQGTLGGDYVNAWPPARPEAYVQNWRRATPIPNSWGLPNLVLAVRPADVRRAFVIRGPLLDYYGRGEGIDAANGVAGYGAPRSDEYAFEGGLAQRFARGLMVIAPDGTPRFIRGDPPSAAAPPGGDVGILESSPPEDLGPETVKEAFRSGWVAAVDRGLPPAAADGPVRTIVFPVSEYGSPAAPPRATIGAGDAAPAVGAESAEPAEGGSARRAAKARYALIQTFGDAAWALVVPVGPGLGQRARLLAPPFLDQALAEGDWASAFAIYGVPLTDPFPRDGKTAQRFSAGWMEVQDH